MVGRRMTLETLLVLRVLWDRLPGGSAYGKELADETGVAPDSIYPMLQRLQRYGWVERVREDGDPAELGRPLRFYYHLTSEGAGEVSEVLAKGVQRYPRVFQPLQPAPRTDLDQRT